METLGMVARDIWYALCQFLMRLLYLAIVIGIVVGMVIGASMLVQHGYAWVVGLVVVMLVMMFVVGVLGG